MVDGVSANTGINSFSSGFTGSSGSGQTPETTALGGTNSLVSLDALQEFRIETSTYAPEFGRTPGGQISLLTRSGTNQFHGSASYYFRNEALDANDWFANRGGQPRPRERQNLFSAVLGGPVKKDRVFFFASYEGLRLQQPKAATGSLVTPDVRAQASPFLKPYLNALPLPNGPVLAPGVAQYTFTYSDPGSFNVSAVRVDAQATKTLNFFGRISHAPSESSTRVGTLSSISKVNVRSDSVTGGVTWIRGSQVTADLRVNWTRNWPTVFIDQDTFQGAIVPAVSDIFAPGRDPSSSRAAFNTGIGFFTWGTGNSDRQRQLNVVGTAVWITGGHQVKLGVDYRRIFPLLGSYGGIFESLGFSGSTSAQIARLMSGQISSYQLTNADPSQREAVFSNLSLFAQDTWRVSRSVTLTYGLRLERVPPPTEAGGRQPRTLLGIENDIPQNPRLAPEGTPLWRSRFGEFAPRFGVAYQLRTQAGWETTVRGGAGIFYDLGLGDIATAFQNVYPFFASKGIANVTLPFSGSVRTPPVLGVDPPQQIYLLDPNLRLPYTIQWNASWEQSLGHSQTLTVGYVGAAGRRLLIRQNYFQTLANWPNTQTFFWVQRNRGRSRYNALQVQYQRRLSRGLQVLASYTLARSKDNASDQSDFNVVPSSQADLFAQQYGPSDFDVRNVLSAAITYDLPKLSGPPMLKASFNDWGLDFLIRYQSAFPVTPTSGTFAAGPYPFFTARPDLVSGQPLNINDGSLPGGRRFNPAAFAAPPAGKQGNFPRNGLRGFPASQVDLALRREFKFGERVRLQLRGELFNLFNHPNFGPPTASITNPLFGQPTQMLGRSLGGLNALYQMGGPRSGQLALKVLW